MCCFVVFVMCVCGCMSGFCNVWVLLGVGFRNVLL